MSAAVSARARSGFDRFMMAAIRNSFALPDAPCVVAPIEETTSVAHEVVMLTVASYRFRVLLFIHFSRDAAIRQHLDNLGGLSAERTSDERFADAIMERGNLCCGALNRELARFFPHLGMSTPCILAGSTLEHLDALSPSDTRRYRAEVAPEVVMHVTLAICASADIDFTLVEEAMNETGSSGELELF